MLRHLLLFILKKEEVRCSLRNCVNPPGFAASSLLKAQQSGTVVSRTGYKKRASEI
jgi:hypothetical protein